MGLSNPKIKKLLTYISGNVTFKLHIFLIFWEIKLFSLKLKKILIFTEMELSSRKFRNCLIFIGGNLRSLKNKNICSEEISCLFIT